MENNLSTIKQRVLYIAELKGVRKSDLVEKMGQTRANFNGTNINTGLNSDAIMKFMDFFPDVSPDWLLTGHGPIMRETPIPVPPDKLEAHREFTQKFKDFAEQIYFLSKRM